VNDDDDSQDKGDDERRRHRLPRRVIVAIINKVVHLTFPHPDRALTLVLPIESLI